MALFKHPAGDDLLRDFKKKDRYRLLGSLKKGPVAEYWRAFDNDLGRIVCVKNLCREYCSDPAKLRSFVNETKLLSYLDHPGIVTIYDTFFNDLNEPCYTLRLLEGTYLGGELKSKSRGQLLTIFAKLCETLAYVHDKGVVHLGIRPDNIMVGQYGEVLLMEWATARLFDPLPYKEYLQLVVDAPPPPIDDSDAEEVPVSVYMSPEQTQGTSTTLSPSSDIFSLGVILYQMMTGYVPFGGDTAEKLVSQIRSSMPPALHEVNPEIPWNLAQICARMLEKDPFQRYHSFHEVLRDIDKFQNSGQAFSTAKYNAGDIIFHEGDPGEYAFTVLSGRVEVTKNIDGKQTVLAILGKDQIVGELAIFAGQPRTATVHALDPNTVIRVMERNDVTVELQKLSPWVGKMIVGLSERFIHLNDLIVEINRKITPDPPGGAHGSGQDKR
jgi:serine/threonine protein kinase